MATTFEAVAEIISDTSDIPMEEITPEKNAFTDLGIDSLGTGWLRHKRGHHSTNHRYN